MPPITLSTDTAENQTTTPENVTPVTDNTTSEIITNHGDGSYRSIGQTTKTDNETVPFKRILVVSIVVMSLACIVLIVLKILK